MNRMNNVYAAPSAEFLVFAPSEKLALNDRGFGFGSYSGKWYQGIIEPNTVGNSASGLGIINGADGKGWLEDGYTLNSDSSS